MSKALSNLVAFSGELGYEVKFVGQDKLRDYAGMNPEAARDLGFKMPDKEIWIYQSMNDRAKTETIIHELIELFLMLKNKRLKYWPAHKIALKEQDISFRQLKRRQWNGKPHRHLSGIPEIGRSR